MRINVSKIKPGGIFVAMFVIKCDSQFWKLILYFVLLFFFSLIKRLEKKSGTYHLEKYWYY